MNFSALFRIFAFKGGYALEDKVGHVKCYQLNNADQVRHFPFIQL